MLPEQNPETANLILRYREFLNRKDATEKAITKLSKDFELLAEMSISRRYPIFVYPEGLNVMLGRSETSGVVRIPRDAVGQLADLLDTLTVIQNERELIESDLLRDDYGHLIRGFSGPH